MRRFFDYWLIYWTSVLTILLAIAYAYNVRVSITLIQEAFNIPAWLIILVFLVSTVLNALTHADWKWHALILSPFVLYGAIGTIAYAISGGAPITGLISGHLYLGVSVTFIFYIAIKQDNQALIKQQLELKHDIELYKAHLATIKSVTNGTK